MFEPYCGYLKQVDRKCISSLLPGYILIADVLYATSGRNAGRERYQCRAVKGAAGGDLLGFAFLSP